MFLKCLLIFVCLMPLRHAELLYSENEVLYVAHALGGVSRFQLASRKLSSLPDIDGIAVIEYDNEHNCLFFAIKNIIRRRCYTSTGESETVIFTHHSNVTVIDRIAYDWISGNLYFIDSLNGRIELLRVLYDEHRAAVDHHPRKTIQSFGFHRKMSGLAVHPIEGYLFWSDMGIAQPAIWRSHLDGSNARVLVERPYVIQPTTMAIDHDQNYLYWIDYMKHEIKRCDFDGKGVQQVAQNTPTGLIVHRGMLFFSLQYIDMILKYNTETGDGIALGVVNLISPTHLTIATGNRSTATNACSNAHLCTEICMGKPGGLYTCVCPNGLSLTSSGECLCPGNSIPFANMECRINRGMCESTDFTCKDQGCVPMIYRCDGDKNCEDGSDEENCPTSSRLICPTNYFRCKSDGKCLHRALQCNGNRDCIDGSDERNCASVNCDANEFRCNDHKCIPQKWRCDGDRDCPDGADEINCGDAIMFKCPTANDFSCGDGICIQSLWVCDGAKDCSNGIDELNCIITTTTARPTITDPRIQAIQTSLRMTTKPTGNGSDSYMLEWDAPNSTDFTYTVHYGKTPIDLLRPKLKLNGTNSIMLSDLMSCEKYMVGVTVENKTLVGDPLHFTTKYDERAPPKQISFIFENKTRSMNIFWAHSCQMFGNHPTEYIVNVTDIVLRNISIVRVEATEKDLQVLRLSSIPRGARYNITVSSIGQAVDTISTYQLHAFTLPSPSPLVVKSLNSNVYISWPPVQYSDTAFNYEVLAAKGYVLDDDVELVLLESTNNTSIRIDTSEWATYIDDATNFTIGVRIRTALGYASDIDDYERIEVQPIDGDEEDIVRDENSLLNKFETEMIIVGGIMLLLGLSYVVAFSIWHCNTNSGPSVDETPMRPIRLSHRIYQPTVDESIFTLGNIEEVDEAERLIAD